MTVLMSKELEGILSNDFNSSLEDNDLSSKEQIVEISENPFFVFYYIDGHVEKFEFKISSEDHKVLRSYLDLRGKRAVIKNLFSDKTVLIEEVKIRFSKNKATLKGFLL